MSVQQQTINIGLLPNDGQGDPLRTAFTKINNNFNSVWAAGPVGSNITITNNTIAAENTNGGIALSAVGNGVITVNRAVIPTVSDIYDLGSSNLTYRTAWIGTGGAFIIGNIITGGNIETEAIYSDNYYYANGAPFIGSSYGNANVVTLGESGWAGNIIPAGNLVYSLGNATNRWSELYLSGNTIFLGNAIISATAGGGISVPGGIAPYYSYIGFFDDIGNSVVKTVTYDEQYQFDVGWTQGATIRIIEQQLYPEIIPPVCSIVQNGSGNLVSITVNTPGVNYPSAAFDTFGGPVILPDGSVTVDSGFAAVVPKNNETLTVTVVGQSDATTRFDGFDIVYIEAIGGGFTVDQANSTVSGSATATGTFGGVLYELTFGLKFNNDGNVLIVDQSTSSITFDGSTSITAGEIFNATPSLYFDYNLLSNTLYYDSDLDQWKLVRDLEDAPPDPPGPPIIQTKVNFFIEFDKYLSIEGFYPAFGSPTTLQAIGNSSVSGSLSVSGNSSVSGSLSVSGNTSVSGNLSVSQTMNGSNLLAQVVGITPGPEPVNPSEGWIAVADGVTWNPAGNGTKQVLIYLNSVWNILSMTPLP